MSKLAAILTAVLLTMGALAVSSPAQARWHHGWHGGWHGGWGYGPSFAFGYGVGYPYYYGGPYYSRPACGWTRLRVWRGSYWAYRRVWRCW